MAEAQSCPYVGSPSRVSFGMRTDRTGAPPRRMPSIGQRRRAAPQMSSTRRIVSSRSIATTPSWMVGAGVVAPASAGTTSASRAW